MVVIMVADVMVMGLFLTGFSFPRSVSNGTEEKRPVRPTSARLKISFFSSSVYRDF